MRRIIVCAFLALSVVLGVAGIAAAQTYVNPDPCIANPAACTQVGGITVTRPAGISTTPSASSQSLAFTGSDSTSTLVWVGGGLALAGGVIVVMTYRRRRASL
jgi:LPXTG-motif cell wall-anchored protein